METLGSIRTGIGISEVETLEKAILNQEQKNETIWDQSKSIINDQTYFTNRLEADLFGHKAIWISHENFGLLLICSKFTDRGWAKVLSMYLFLQYYRHFTPQLLKEFYDEDSHLKELELSLVSGREALRSASGMYSAINNRIHDLDEKQPFGELMNNFKETFEKVFVDEKPNNASKYNISTICVIQIATKRLYDTLFSFTFMKDTTNDIQYASSDVTKKINEIEYLNILEKWRTFILKVKQKIMVQVSKFKCMNFSFLMC